MAEQVPYKLQLIFDARTCSLCKNQRAPCLFIVEHQLFVCRICIIRMRKRIEASDVPWRGMNPIKPSKWKDEVYGDT